jgi:hypothetical protein
MVHNGEEVQLSEFPVQEKYQYNGWRREDII